MTYLHTGTLYSAVPSFACFNYLRGVFVLVMQPPCRAAAAPRWGELPTRTVWYILVGIRCPLGVCRIFFRAWCFGVKLYFFPEKVGFVARLFFVRRSSSC